MGAVARAALTYYGKRARTASCQASSQRTCYTATGFTRVASAPTVGERVGLSVNLFKSLSFVLFQFNPTVY